MTEDGGISAVTSVNLSSGTCEMSPLNFLLAMNRRRVAMRPRRRRIVKSPVTARQEARICRNRFTLVHVAP